jgi:hypothetical protein
LFFPGSPKDFLIPDGSFTSVEKLLHNSFTPPAFNILRMLKLVLFAPIFYSFFAGQEQFPFFLIGRSEIGWVVFCLPFINLLRKKFGVSFGLGLGLLGNWMKIRIDWEERNSIKQTSFVLY